MGRREQEGKGFLGKLSEAYQWTVDRLNKTSLMAIKYTLPSRLLNPHGFLGMLTFSTFIILGITGALLMFYYKPTLTGAYDSVASINDEIEFGFVLRNIHYHASNAMVLLALYHMFYVLFAARYKNKNEVIWITGVILGTLTVIEAYTGYDLILNERAVLAINIGVSLANSVPFIGPDLARMIIGTGFSDIVLRFYALHVLIIPVLMMFVMAIHFPKGLIIDIPMISIVAGAILIAAGVAPVELGTKFDPDVPPGITVPEWYLSGLYAFIRTGIDKFVAGVLLPAIFILVFMVVPFLDRGRQIFWWQRPLVSGIAISGIGQIILTTVWGFYIHPDPRLPLDKRLFIDPIPYYLALVVVIVLSFAFTYGYSRWMSKRQSVRRRPAAPSKPVLPQEGVGLWGAGIAIVVLQALVLAGAAYAYSIGLRNLSLIAIGVSLIAFAILTHAVRVVLSSRR